jgi:hypothetical protein
MARIFGDWRHAAFTKSLTLRFAAIFLTIAFAGLPAVILAQETREAESIVDQPTASEPAVAEPAAIEGPTAEGVTEEANWMTQTDAAFGLVVAKWKR